MPTRTLPLLDLAGPPREVGRAHGEAARDRIAHNLAVYFERFAGEALLPREEALRRAAQYLIVIERQAPDYAELMRGVAEASGHDLLEIAALNARYELLYSSFAKINVAALQAGRWPGEAAGGCTAFAALSEATPDGHLRIGQNWDWIPEVQGLLLRVERADGHRLLCFTEAGIVGGKIGLNSAGIGLAINGLLSDRDSWARLRTPFHVRTWRVLNSQTLDEALDAVLSEEQACSANFLIAQARGAGEGAAVDLETAPGASCRLEPRRGLLAHANHFLDPDRLGIWQPLAEERDSTYHRHARMERLLAEHHGRLDAATLQTILRDHDGRPESVCRHPNPAWGPSEAYETVVSVIMDLHARDLLVSAGPPCGHEYQRVPLAA